MATSTFSGTVRVASLVLLGLVGWGCAPDATAPEPELTAAYAKPVFQTAIPATFTLVSGAVAGDIRGPAYSNNVCGVLARVFLAGTTYVDGNMQTDNSQAGDASCSLLGGTSASVPRKLTITYPDNGAVSSNAGGLNVTDLGGVNGTATRPLGIRIAGSSTRRCASLGFGNSAGGTPVSVTRTSASSWRVTAVNATARCTPPKGSSFNITGFNFEFDVTLN
jgi:hypothetical protein